LSLLAGRRLLDRPYEIPPAIYKRAVERSGATLALDASRALV